MADIRLADKDRADIAAFVVAEWTRRKGDSKRDSLAKQWKEIDRQLRMEPRPQRARDDAQGRTAEAMRKWMAAIEMPDQAEAFEIIVDDVERILFPPGDEWFASHVVLSDEYAQKMVGQTLVAGADEPITEMDQDTADLIVQSTLHQFHSLYKFRGHVALFTGEAVKYGTCVARIGMVSPDLTAPDYRGLDGRSRKIPMFIPMSIKTTYLDDAPESVMHEGVTIAPTIVWEKWQKKDDLVRAAKSGDGWLPEIVAGITPKGTKRNNHILIMEGDIILERSRGSKIMENAVATVVEDDGPKLIRLQQSPLPFRSIILDHYQRDDVDSAYGTSPLMKGRPLQEAQSEAMNRAINAAALRSDPVMIGPSDDEALAAEGGLILEPGGQILSDKPDKVRPIEVGDPGVIFAMAQDLHNRHRSLTSTNEPRASGSIKSHTTAEANALAEARQVLRTVDFANGLSMGSLRTFLYMEFELARDALRTPLEVFVPSEKGHMEIARRHWPERANFRVLGASGVLEQQAEVGRFMQAINTIAQIEPFAVQQGAPPTDWNEVRRTIYEMFRIDHANRFIRRGGTLPGGAETGSDVSRSAAELVQGLEGAAGV